MASSLDRYLPVHVINLRENMSRARIYVKSIVIYSQVSDTKKYRPPTRFSVKAFLISKTQNKIIKESKTEGILASFPQGEAITKIYNYIDSEFRPSIHYDNINVVLDWDYFKQMHDLESAKYFRILNKLKYLYLHMTKKFPTIVNKNIYDIIKGTLIHTLLIESFKNFVSIETLNKISDGLIKNKIISYSDFMTATEVYQEVNCYNGNDYYLFDTSGTVLDIAPGKDKPYLRHV